MTTETNRLALAKAFALPSGVALLAAAVFIVAIAVAMPGLAKADGPAGDPWYGEEYFSDYGGDDWFGEEYYSDYGGDDWYGEEYYGDSWVSEESWYSIDEWFYEEDYSSYSYFDSYEPYYSGYYYDYYDYHDYGCGYDCYSGCDYGCNSGCHSNCNPPPKPDPVCALSASDTTIEEGESTTLHWTSENAHSATLSSFGSVQTGGSRSVSPDNDTTYTLKVTGQGGTDTCSVTIRVEEEDEDDLWCELDVSDSTVEEGDEVTLEWDTRGATYASINEGIGRVDEDGGEEEVDVDDDTTFRLTVRDRDGDEETCTARVRVEDENDFSSISFDGDPVNNPPTVYLSQLPYTGPEDDLSPSLIASLIMLAGLLGIGGYFFFVKKQKAA